MNQPCHLLEGVLDLLSRQIPDPVRLLRESAVLVFTLTSIGISCVGGGLTELSEADRGALQSMQSTFQVSMPSVSGGGRFDARSATNPTSLTPTGITTQFELGKPLRLLKSVILPSS